MYEIQTIDGATLASADDVTTAKRLTDILPGAYQLVRCRDGRVLARHSRNGLSEHLHTYGRDPAVTLPRARTVQVRRAIR